MGGFELSSGRAAGGQGAAGGQETSQKKFMRQNSQTSRELVCVCVCVYRDQDDWQTFVLEG